MALLPIFLFISIFLLFTLEKTFSWRESFLLSSLMFGSILTIITEILSLFDGLSFWPLAIFWVICLLVAVILLISKRQIFQRFKLPKLHQQQLSIPAVVLVLGILTIFSLVGLTAFQAAPNNWDSFTYHLSRVEHWVQNKNLSFYPTHALRQLHMNPWTEYAILNFRLLRGDDKFANLVQWFSLVGNAIGVSLLAQLLGASKRGQLLSAIFSTTLPMGILQGSSTQNDLVVSFWLVCFVYFTSLYTKDRNSLLTPFIGLALGLAVLTKGTAYVYALPFLLWVCIDCFYKMHIRSLKYLTFVAIIVLLLNSGLYIRNISFFKTPFISKEGTFTLNNAKMSAPLLTSNLLRNMALHFGTPYEKGNVFLEQSIAWFHDLIGVSENDENTTWIGARFQIPRGIYNEEFAGNPLHLAILVGTVMLFIFQKEKPPGVSLLLIATLSAAVLYCLIFRWQPWNSRLHLPLFILLSPLVGYVLTRHQRLNGLAIVLGLILLVMAGPWVMNNQLRPLVGKNNIFLFDRHDLYFFGRQHLQPSYEDAGNLISKSSCMDIGLVTGNDSPEYLLWVVLKEKLPKGFRIENININNNSKVLANEFPFKNFDPCKVVVINYEHPSEIIYRDKVFQIEWDSDFIGIYKPN